MVLPKNFTQSIRKGFTLIEILIVISLLGVLAVALLATIDPLEQINKGNDTKTRSALQEIYGAFNRYYAIRQEYPWQAVAVSAAPLGGGAGLGYLNTAITAGELKAGFVASIGAATLNTIFLTSTAPAITLCFQPVSKGLAYDKNAVYTNTGGAGVNCKGAAVPGAVTCFWCISS